MCAWNAESDTEKSSDKVIVKVYTDGDTVSEEFSSDTTVREACREMAQRTSLKTFIVRDGDDNEIEQSEGDSELGDFPGPIVLTAKAAGS